MDQVYSGHGVRFCYPTGWELAENQEDQDVAMTVVGEGTSFWTLQLLAGRPDPGRVLEEALKTFHGEYAELDEYPIEATINQTRCQARDVQFMQYELINSAFLRAFPWGCWTAFVLYQGNDEELNQTRPLLEAITASLSWDGDA